MGLSFNIAIDGHSSCGKSTIAKNIASKYGMYYIDTGAMYRAITLYFMRKGIIQNQQLYTRDLLMCINDVSIDFEFDVVKNESQTILNGENVERYIRGMQVSNNVSIIAQIKEVRDKLISIQQEFAKSKNVVMEGRDIGTKVIPEAKLKLFITASIDIRAQRRYNELFKKGDDISLEQVRKNINDRDSYDINRSINPLIQAKDAVLIDNTDLSFEDQEILIDNLIKKYKNEYYN
tara:strand:+ start:435 stop:1136 length:702 start_codon:yes stop_codon:yes gene_type:complete